jgi:hypothetical protein
MAAGQIQLHTMAAILATTAGTKAGVGRQILFEVPLFLTDLQYQLV